MNSGTAALHAGTASTAGLLINGGTPNIYGDAAGDIGKLTVGTLEPVAGLIKIWDTGGTLIVGSGAVPSGFSGYYQFANGIFDEAGGALEVNGPIDSNGTLDILLSDGYKPVDSVFTVLS